MVIEGTSDARAKYVQLHYMDKWSDEARQKFVETHVHPEGAAGRCGGFHLLYWDNLIKKRGGGCS